MDSRPILSDDWAWLDALIGPVDDDLERAASGGV
jgi:hypothetical protein